MSEPKSKLAYTVQEAAEAMGVSKSSIYNRIKDRELETFTWCGRTLIRADVLQRAMDRASGRAAA